MISIKEIGVNGSGLGAVTSVGWALVVMIFLLWGCRGNINEGETAASDCATARYSDKISLSTAETLTVTEMIPLTGMIASHPDRVVHFVTLVDGVISRVLFSLGDAVRQGSVLAEIRSPELSALHAEGVSVRSKLRLAKRHLAAVTAMYDDGVSSRRDLLEAEGEVQQLQAELERVESVMALYGATATPGVFQIRAPVSGFVTEKRITPGMQVAAGGEPLFTLADLSEVWVLANVYAGSVTRVTKGLEVGIRTLSYPGEVFPGTISALSHVFDEHEKVLRARVVLDNPDHRLKPGMLAEIDVIRPAGHEAVAIPTDALIFDNNKNHVVIYHDECSMELREVELLLRRDDRTFLSGGVETGEQVVTRNQLLVFEELKNRLSE
jgi:membrane fusion protein, heavy metal efflux system